MMLWHHHPLICEQRQAMYIDPTGGWRYSPQDLHAWLEGDFAAWCEREAAEVRQGRLAPPAERQPDPVDDDLQLAARYGTAHEQKYLAQLRQQYPDLVEVPADAAQRAPATRAALHSGAPVIYQGWLEADEWCGIADFLHRTPEPSQLGDWSYQPSDTKLARSARPYFLLQLCLYADVLATMQGRRPTQLSVVLGDGTLRQFATNEYWYYYRHLRRRFIEFQRSWCAEDGPPDPAADRSHGRWSGAAAALLDARDDLSAVAGISGTQIAKLRQTGITSVAELAECPAAPCPAGMSAASFTRLRDQAAMQIRTRREGRIAWTLRTPDPTDPRRGLALLPPPSTLDVFYDIEGFPYAEAGLEYLQGATTVAADGGFQFHDWWAHDAASERVAFEQFIDWVYQRWQQDPGMHIYHYAGYERTAIARLSTRYGTREDQVDDLLRHNVLVDLLEVVRQGLIIGTPGYSLKLIEPLYLPPREGEVVSAMGSVAEYQRWLDSGESTDWADSPILKAIRDYNQRDCEATAGLRDWLLQRQQESGIAWQPLTVAEPSDTSPSPSPSGPGTAPAERQQSPAQLLAQQMLTRAESLTGEEQRLHQLLAWLLEYHRRDAKPLWWRYFERRIATAEQLAYDADCLADLRRTAADPLPDKQSLLYQYSFDPNQDSRLHPGDRVELIAPEPIKGTIASLDYDTGLLQIKRGKAQQTPMPSECHLIPLEHVAPGPLPGAIERYVRQWQDGGMPSRAIDDLLHRRRPRLSGRGAQPIVNPDAPLVAETIAAIRAMDRTTLAIQGPPGTGKSTTAAAVIATLLADGQRVGIMAQSHAVISHLLGKISATDPTATFPIFKVAGSEPVAPGVTRIAMTKDAATRFSGGADPVVVGGTAWFFARPELVDQFDYLFVDEAGQVSLANVVAAGQSARNIVLIGDQMQLAQVVQGSHPGESGMSALEYLLHGHQTIPADMGILLDRSYRMAPSICQFISDSYYEGRLGADPRTLNNRVEWDGLAAGIQFIPVAHQGDDQSSTAEVAVIAELITKLTGRPAHIAGRQLSLSAEQILVVAPFNAQVRALTATLNGAARVGTVDKFQGQEAPVVIVSMCASSLDDAPRGAGFLLSPNRLNVALSRAQALALVVGSPRLADVRVRSVEEMRLVNGWCRIQDGV